MNAVYFAWKNAIAKPLRFTFNILLIALASGLITVAFLVNVQFKNHFEKNLANTDLILSAKGSPLQSVLCNMFHADVPTGNITLSESRPFLNTNHPIIKRALPLSLGDQVGGYRIIGTTHEYFQWYSLTLSQGEFFKEDLEAVVGFDVAHAMKLKPGSTFISGHGFTEETESLAQHDHHHFRVTGILEKSGSVADRMVFVSISSYWTLHHEHSEEDSLHRHHEKPCIRNGDLLHEDGNITSILLEFKGNNIQSLNFGRSINENTGLMAANPAIELNRLYELTGSATDLLSMLAGILIALATLSMFISLWQAMEDRKYEMALLRIGGATSFKMFQWVFLEAMILCTAGLLCGLFSAHVILAVSADTFSLQSKYGINGFTFVREEAWIFCIGLLIGLASASIPAWRAIKTNIHLILTEN